MKILDEVFSTLDYDAQVREIRQGPFQTAVSTRYCGLASTPHVACHHHDRFPVNDAGNLKQKDARSLSRLAESDSPFEAAIGMATVNSLLEVNEEECLDLNAGRLIAEKGQGRNIAIVGHFPFIDRLREEAKELWVIEKNPQQGDRTEAEAEDLIPRADVVGITGTAFTNHTIQSLLGLCSPRSYVVLLGDTAPLCPVLFDFGVDAISGTRVTDPESALRCVSQGATYRQIQGIRRLTMIKRSRSTST